MTAYQAQDYTTAEARLRPLAEQGDAEAQYLMGVMHYEGQGVPRDYVEAMIMWRRAAEQGHREAQRAVCREVVDFDYCEEVLNEPAGQ